MKRVLWIILALLLFAAPAIAESATVEGDWELISIVIEGNIYENLAQQGMTMTMRLEADGTGVQTVNGEIYPCTWVETDGEILIGDSDGTMSYALQADGTLRGEDQVGDVMLFARAAAADSVAGEWKLTSAETEGITVNDTTTLNITLDLVLNADGTGRLTSSEGEGACTWTQSGASITVAVEDGGSLLLTLQSDGTLTWVIDDMTLILSRTDDATEVSEPSESAAIVSEYGFRVQLPEGWVALDSDYIEKIIKSVGEEVASANGLDQSLLDQLAAASTSLYYASDMSANFNVVREPAGDVTMDTFALLEPTYQEIFSSTQGITDFKLSGPVDINGKTYYVGTFTAQAGLEQKQYFCVANGYIYTLTLTNVPDGDAEQIMGSFEIL